MTTASADNTVDSADQTLPATEAATSENTGSSQRVVEERDGKLFVDGVRVYTRDDTNKIASNAKKQAEISVLETLEVDSIDAVKSVLSELRGSEADQGVDVKSLRDVVRKKSATVDELQKQVQSLRTQLVEKDHVSKLVSEMPSHWTQSQREGVLDLMRARDMISINENQFVLRDGENYFTQDGETPDYGSAVQHVGKMLGLPMGKTGVSAVEGTDSPKNTAKRTGIDTDKLSNDRAYRSAYVKLRSLNPGLTKQNITNQMIQDAITKYNLDKL